ncbi:MAG TPA: BTAD domain-containing putative transcriptional regulator [Mycobacteriales bacterium]|nr:BTAD domain-containing putative transcriptional regulator [Mycobacteriales bacterium]
MVSVGVLGATTLTGRAGPVPLGGPLPRRLVAALALAGGRPVSVDAVAEALWEDGAPPGVTGTVQAYVSRLRRALGEDRAALQREGAGYRLVTRSSDAQALADRAAQAGALLARGDLAGAAERARDGLALWRGGPYADLPDLAHVVAERARLEELHESVVEVLLRTRVQAGGAEAVSELEAAVRSAPYREGRWELLVLALYRAGRQADALEALRRVRALLGEELGVDPGPGLQELEQRVLAQDPRLLLVPRQTVPAAAPARPVRPLSTLHGRAEELQALSRALVADRLVTLVGPGGCGKTRLAVEAAAGADGPVWLVRLADVHEPSLVPPTLARAVGLAAPGTDPLATAAEALAGTSGLLVLDNCEHLLASAGAAATVLLGRCPGLRVLATSREPLGQDGETVLDVAPLAVTAPDGGDGPAVAMLLERVGRVRPGWRPTPGELADARRLCRVLDGLPLAVELAAARSRALSLGDLSDLLAGGLAGLPEVTRPSLTPHRTLSDTVAWSIGLLSAEDRRVLLRLWPFEGGFDLDLAGRALGGPELPLQALSSLVSKSLVAADITATPTRYRLWETVRAHLQATDPDPAGSREAHAAAVHELALQCAHALRGRRTGHVVAVLDRELPNLRAALRHDLTAAPERALRTFGRLEWYWFRTGAVAEGLALATAVLDAAPDADAEDRARSYGARATLSVLGGDLDAGLRSLSAAGALLADRPCAFRGHLGYYEAVGRTAIGDAAGALPHARASEAAGRAAGDPVVVATGTMATGAVLLALGRTDEGEHALEEAVALADACGIGWTVAMSRCYLAQDLLRRRPLDPARTRAVLAAALEGFVEEADVSSALAVVHMYVVLLTREGHPEAAAELLAGLDGTARRLGLRLEDSGLVPADLRALVPPLNRCAASPARAATAADLLALARQAGLPARSLG